MKCENLRRELDAIKSLKEAVDALAPKMKKENEPLRTTTRELMANIRERITSLRESILPREFKELIATEQQKLSAFFGTTIDVPPLPKDITRERFHEWQKLGFELHYLPSIEMKEESDFPGWKKKPGKKYAPDRSWNTEFFEDVRDGNLPPDTLTLKPGWVLIDGRQKSDYVNDPLAPIIQKLRQGKNPLIQKCKHTSDDSRLGTSWDELNKPDVKLAFAKALHLAPDQLSLPRAIEWNVLGNLHHPEWSDTDTMEWFEDFYGGGQLRLCGGGSRDGGISHVHWSDFDERGNLLGFRLLGRL